MLCDRPVIKRSRAYEDLWWDFAGQLNPCEREEAAAADLAQLLSCAMCSPAGSNNTTARHHHVTDQQQQPHAAKKPSTAAFASAAVDEPSPCVSDFAGCFASVTKKRLRTTLEPEQHLCDRSARHTTPETRDAASLRAQNGRVLVDENCSISSSPSNEHI